MNTRGLKAALVKSGYTQEKIANEIGISPRTFSNKMKKGVFLSDEIEKMIKLLNIEDPMAIFFTL